MLTAVFRGRKPDLYLVSSGIQSSNLSGYWPNALTTRLPALLTTRLPAVLVVYLI